MEGAIFTGTHGRNHIQGIAVDEKKGFIYYSFTTQLVKATLDGRVIGSVTGLTGHLGCIDFCEADGKVYGSLEYKNDSIGKGINRTLGIEKEYEDAFYMTIFDVDKIDRPDMDAEKDGVMTAVYLKTVVDDYNGTGKNGQPHRYGCSGIDGTTFGPLPGSKDGKEYLFVCYGIYGDLNRTDVDYQVMLCYDTADWNGFAKPLSQEAMHHSGPAEPTHKFFVYTGNTVWGVQNLEYDRFTDSFFMAVYAGTKPEFPNYDLFAVDASVPPKKEMLRGLEEEGLCLTLKKVGKPVHPEVFGWHFPLGSTGLYAYGDGRYLICQNFKAKTGQCGILLPFVYDEKAGFLLDA
jgi:hypothetical protein